MPENPVAAALTELQNEINGVFCQRKPLLRRPSAICRRTMVRTHADDDNDRKLLTDIANHGWHIVGIKDDPGAPAYAFSVGLFHTLGQPEVCIFGLDSTSTMGQIINQVGSLMKTGETFEDWHESDDVLDGYSMMFRQVDQQHYA